MTVTEKPYMFGYVRVSTEEQVDSRAGLDAQEAAIKAEAERRGWDIELFRDEGKSGKHVNEGLREALELLASGQGDGLVVAKMDRLVRSSQHASEILATAERQGWNLSILDMGIDLATPAGNAMAQMLAVFAEFERRMISQRTKDALAQKKASGVAIGRPRLAKPAVVRRIVMERNAGLSFARIARTLTTEGVLSPAGRSTWQESTVRRIFQSTNQSGAI
ncbi:recombinase family protein [Rhodococcus erythropolis]|uniref:recombinase family protein n=1 Tax=Rhodococcus erythropolis TaxID=1833 RepID=UPI00037E40E0|nr:recombinase family protein [Rhodococcus erythropolis]